MITKIALIEPASDSVHVFTKFKLPRLGLPILGAQIEKEFGIKPRIYFEDLARLDWEFIMDSDLVGISTITATAPEA
ncbi:MAG: radical SAM protein, partial [Actinobacteria bacterium]|nr:radical SAM protein [Actinomycetota bacterium]